MVETIGYPAIIAAADAAAKAADVQIATYQKADSGIITIYIIGDVASVQAAVAVGEEVAKRVGQFRHSHVIPRPTSDVVNMLFPEKKAEEEKSETKAEPVKEAPAQEEKQTGSQTETKDINKMNLNELREYANSFSNFPKTTQEIYRAKKEDLLNELTEIMKGGDK
nr:BMC domain-containing protein [Bacillus piscicola]